MHCERTSAKNFRKRLLYSAKRAMNWMDQEDGNDKWKTLVWSFYLELGEAAAVVWAVPKARFPETELACIGNDADRKEWSFVGVASKFLSSRDKDSCGCLRYTSASCMHVLWNESTSAFDRSATQQSVVRQQRAVMSSLSSHHRGELILLFWSTPALCQ